MGERNSHEREQVGDPRQSASCPDGRRFLRVVPILVDRRTDRLEQRARCRPGCPFLAESFACQFLWRVEPGEQVRVHQASEV